MSLNEWRPEREPKGGEHASEIYMSLVQRKKGRGEQPE